jgi:hypothetical protein
VAVTVTVAVAGDPKTALVADGESVFGMRDPEDFEQPYDERPTVEVTGEETDTVGEVLRRAADEAGVVFPDWSDSGVLPGVPFVDFYREGHYPTLRRELALIDSDGRLCFVWKWQEVTYRELLDAADAGLIQGDPRRPYLLFQPGIGNGLLVDWQTLVTAWIAFWYVLDKIDIALGVGERAKKALDTLRGRTREAPQVLEGLYAEWQERGARPDNLDELLGERPWHLDDLADLLGCTVDQAEAFLLGAGYAASHQTGLYSRAADAEAELLHGNLEFVIQTAMTARRDAIDDVLRRRLERFLEAGNAPPLDWQGELSSLPDDGIGLRDPDAVAAEQAAMEPGPLRRLWWRIRYR